MNNPGYSNSLQTYQCVLYRRPLHPELFSLKGRRLIKHNAYELEAWLLPGGHVLRFKFGSFVCSELVIDQDGKLPTDGAVTAFPCAGDHEFEHAFSPEKTNYITSVQTETLSENLYNATYDEMRQFAKDADALTHAWDDTSSGFHGVAPTPYNHHASVNGFASDGYAAGGLATASPRRNLSLLDIQRLSREIHVQSYHLIAAQGLVLRTQTIFEHK
ncbi:MAG TPA: hypothetical protein PL072_01745 [Phycisphaerales bacterium]|nr:hypothetical protein [Phycisphaerales bacterium]